jgi:hypothetical protein
VATDQGRTHQTGNALRPTHPTFGSNRVAVYDEPEPVQANDRDNVRFHDLCVVCIGAAVEVSDLLVLSHVLRDHCCAISPNVIIESDGIVEFIPRLLAD